MPASIAGRSCSAEVASVYAEVFHRLGYLAVDHLIGPAPWRELTAGLRRPVEGRDVRRSEAEALLRAPPPGRNTPGFWFPPRGPSPREGVPCFLGQRPKGFPTEHR